MAFDGLSVQQNLGDAGEGLFVLHQHIAGALVGLLDDAADLGVDQLWNGAEALEPSTRGPSFSDMP